MTDEQLKAMGLYTDAPQVSMTPAGPPPIMSGPTQYPQSILGSKIPTGAQIPTTHQEGQQEFQQLMPRITSTPGTADYFRQRQEQLDFKAQHPWGDPISAHPGTLGKIGHITSAIGNIAGNIVSPGTMALIPGTQLHNAIMAHGNEQGILAGEKAENEQARTQAENTESEARTEALGAQKEHTEAETNQLNAPPPKDTFEKLSDGSLVQLTTDPHTGNSSVKLLYKGDGKTQTDVIQRQIGNEQHNVLINKMTGEDIKDLGPKKEEGQPGSLSLQEDAQGNPVAFNSKTGAVTPMSGVQKTGTAAKKQAEYEKNVAGPEADLTYADSYVKNKVYTGPGDEALMEKFFDLAKPSTGFRMTQPQIEMLNNARSWMNGMEAHLRHATTGTWFSDEQRQQIADTMKQLHEAKTKAIGQGPQGGGTPNGRRVIDLTQ